MIVPLVLPDSDYPIATQLGESLTGHTGGVCAVAVGALGGKTIAVAGPRTGAR